MKRKSAKTGKARGPTRPRANSDAARLAELLADLRELIVFCGFDAELRVGRRRRREGSGYSRSPHFMRLRHGDPAGEVLPAARILQLWHCDPLYLQESGQPRALPLRGEHSFETLVRAAGCNLPVKPVRDVFEKTRLVKVSNGRARPLLRAVVSGEHGSVAQFYFSLRDMFHTLRHNLIAGQESSKVFHRYVFDTCVPASRAEEFRKYFEIQGMAFLLSIEEWLHTAEQQAAGREPLESVHVHLFCSPFRPVPRNGPGSDTTTRMPRKSRRARS